MFDIIEDNLKKLVDQYYPNALIQEAIIPEGVFDLQLNEDSGCQDIDGLAIDSNRDGRSDFFLFEKKFYSTASITAKSLDDYIKPLACFVPPNLQSQTCENKSEEITPYPFPFKGNLLPDSMGKISSIMLVASRGLDPIAIQLIKLRPDLKYQILTLPTEFIPENLTRNETKFLADEGKFLPDGLAQYALSHELAYSESFSFFPAGLRESDFEIPHPEIWPQDQFFVGTNERGQIVASAHSLGDMDSYVTPLMQTLGAIPYETDQFEDGGDVLSSSTHIFVPNMMRLSPEMNFAQVFAHNKQIVSIEKLGISSAAHIDMILTPTEEHQDGKPVVILAQGADLFDRPRSETQELDKIAKFLEQAGFYVERIPYVYDGYRRSAFSPQSVAFSYNNVLMENYQENGSTIKRVYMPWYGQKFNAFNKQAESVYQKYGYEVIPITGLDEPAGEDGGALRCLIKVTKREYLNPQNL